MRIFDLEISGSVNLSGSILMNNIQETSSAFKNLVLDENNVISFQSGGLNTISSSFAEFANTASLLIGLVESASYAVTSSYALNVPNVSQYWTESVEGFISRESNVQITGSLDISNLIYGSLLGTASFAVISETASYALNGGGTGGLWTESGDFISRQSDVEITGSLSVSNGITGSILGSSSYALTASYALNGGTGGSTFPFAGGFVSQSYTNEATWSLAHNLNKQYLSVEVYNSDNEIIIPEKIIATDENNIVIYFPVTQSGTALVTYGGNVSTSSYALTASYFDGNIESSSYSISSSYSDYALTASYALNGGGGGGSITQFVIPTMSFNDTASLTGLTLTDEKFAMSVVETVQYEGIDENTILMLSFDRSTGNITDRTGKHIVTTGSTGPTFNNSLGNYKFGDDSAYLPNSNNAYVIVPYTASDYDLSQSAFTIDFWINPLAINRYQSFFNQGTTLNNRCYALISTTNVLQLVNVNNGGTAFNAVAPVAIPTYQTGQWYHIAIVKKPFDDPNQVMFFANGEFLGGATSSAGWLNIASDNRIFTTYYPTTTTTNTYAYIDELRYSNIARWTESFAVPYRQYELTGSSRVYGQVDNINYSAEVSESEGVIKIRKISGGNSTNVKFNILQ